jgi:hypothetical protein
MIELATVDLIGYWLGIFLTFCILSFLYKDNPFYKLAEHLFIGVSIGYVITQQYYNVLRPKLVERIAGADHWWWNLELVPLLLVALLFVKAVSRRWAWLGRYPLAFVVALYAGIQINAVAQADLGQQIKRATDDLDEVAVNVNTADVDALTKLPGVSPGIARQIVLHRPFASLDELERMPDLDAAELELLREARGSLQGLDAQAAVTDGQRYWFGIVSNVLLLLGLLAALIYFYFSVEHKGAIGKVSRFGIWVLMIGFGASFGYTVQGRIALAIGRAPDVLGMDKEAQVAEQIHGPVVALVSIVLIVAGIAVWEVRQRRSSHSTPGQDLTS